MDGEPEPPSSDDVSGVVLLVMVVPPAVLVHFWSTEGRCERLLLRVSAGQEPFMSVGDTGIEPDSIRFAESVLTSRNAL